MLAKVISAGVMGVDGFLVTVECDTGPGLNSFEVVGLAEAAVRESRVRVRSALINSGIEFPTRRIVINLAPADVPKRGTIYDLPLAVALLVSEGSIAVEAVAATLIVGELSLTGEVRPVPGVLPMVIAARDAGCRQAFVPAENAAEAAVVGGIEVFAVPDVAQLVLHLMDQQRLELCAMQEVREAASLHVPDMADVKGQEWVKEALVVAAAGGHNMLMCGPPGSGKTMLARRLAGILPPMNSEESLETTKVYSVSGLLSRHAGLVSQRPFRAPHHTISNVGLVGGGSVPRPGEVSLAHNGVLFLDELPEFPRGVLECLRQPLEDRFVTVSRAVMSCSFPSSFTLVASMNPCPCGNRGSERKPCTCDDAAVARYISRISGPLMDRIDMHVDVRGVEFEQLRTQRKGPDSATLRQRVCGARAIQEERFREAPHCQNASMTPSELVRHCKVDSRCERVLESAFQKRGLSARSYDRVLKVARTLADLDAKETIGLDHVAQALNYRQLDGVIQ